MNGDRGQERWTQPTAALEARSRRTGRTGSQRWCPPKRQRATHACTLRQCTSDSDGVRQEAELGVAVHTRRPRGTITRLLGTRRLYLLNARYLVKIPVKRDDSCNSEPLHMRNTECVAKVHVHAGIDVERTEKCVLVLSFKP